MGFYFVNGRKFDRLEDIQDSVTHVVFSTEFKSSRLVVP